MTRKGVWDIQDVRDKLLAGDPWLRFNNLYTAGINIQGMLGQNNQDGSGAGSALGPVSIPTTADTRDWAHVKGSSYSSAGITEDGNLFTWGAGYYGALGLNAPYNSSKSEPVQVPGTTWDSLGNSGGDNYLATKTDGTMWFWGQSSAPTGYSRGFAGWPANTSCSSPVQVPGTSWAANPGRQDQQKYLFTRQAAYAVDDDGKLWTQGLNPHGELGQNNSSTSTYKAQVGTDTTWKWVAGYTGSSDGFNAAAIKTDGTLWTWGGGGPQGSLGTGPDKTARSSPAQIPGTSWDSIAGGNIYWTGGGFGSIRTDGTLWVWGATDHGAFGTNQYSVQYSSPYGVPGGPYVACGFGRNAMWRMKGDGTVWISGDVRFAGLEGETGHNYMSSPVQVPGTVVAWDKDKMNMTNTQSYGWIGGISPNLTPTQL